MSKPWMTLVTLDYPPERGGMARYLWHLVEESKGEVDVVVEKGSQNRDPNVTARELVWPAWPKWWPMVRIAYQLGKTRRMVLVSHVFPVGTAAWISKMLGGPRYAVILHGLDVRLVQGAKKRWLFKRICKNAAAVFVNSEATKKEVLDRIPGLTTCMLTPGVTAVELCSRADARKKLGIDPERRLVVSVARLVERKGIDVSLRAMGRIQKKTDVDYVVIGDGQDRERLQEIAEESRTGIRWVRNAADEEKNLWLAAADVFLLPVRESSQDMEGFGIVYLEAAMAGIPSVAGKSGGAGEAVIHERTGLLVKPTDLDEVEAAIWRLLLDKDLAKNMGEEGRKRAMEEFGWPQRWETMKRVLGE